MPNHLELWGIKGLAPAGSQRRAKVPEYSHDYSTC